MLLISMDFDLIKPQAQSIYVQVFFYTEVMFTYNQDQDPCFS